jgi:hypothetical protein
MKLCHRVAKFPVSASLILAIGTLLAFDAAAGSVEILATGLANPRGIAIGPAGASWWSRRAAAARPSP